MKLAKICAFLGLAAACSGTPTNFAGSYSLTLTDNANDCNVPNWTPGNTSTIQATFTQDGSNAQVNVQGALVQAFFDAAVGAHSFQGTVSGNEFTSEYVGTASSAQPCNHTFNITIDATLDSNSVLSGMITLKPVTNGDASCGVLNTCSNTITLSGNRTGP